VKAAAAAARDDRSEEDHNDEEAPTGRKKGHMATAPEDR